MNGDWGQIGEVGKLSFFVFLLSLACPRFLVSHFVRVKGLETPFFLEEIKRWSLTLMILRHLA